MDWRCQWSQAILWWSEWGQVMDEFMDEYKALLELVGMLLTDPRIAVLFVLLIVAAVNDYRTYKIPNWLTASGTAFALVYSVAAPASSHAGFLWAIEGLLLGFFALLPFYVLKIMGAGDVKLMAMTGAFLGVPDTLHVLLATFIIGGIAAFGFAFFKRALGRMLSNVRHIAQRMMLSAIGGIRPEVRVAASESVGRMPYGVSIGIGTIAYLLAKQLGYW